MVARALEEMFQQMARSGWQIHALAQGLSLRTGPEGNAGGAVDVLARGTGGRAYENFTRPATEEFLERTSVTYLLRFRTEASERSRGREKYSIRTAEPDSDIELTYRDFFYAPEKRENMNEAERLIADAQERLRELARRSRDRLEISAAAIVLFGSTERAHLIVNLPGSQLPRLAAEAKDLESRVRLVFVAGLPADDDELGGRVLWSIRWSCLLAICLRDREMVSRSWLKLSSTRRQRRVRSCAWPWRPAPEERPRPFT